MPRSPNTPCLECGKLCWPSYKDGRKRESQLCHDCRRTVVLRSRRCAVCGSGFVTSSRSRKTCSARCAYGRPGDRSPDEQREHERARMQAKCRRRRALKAGGRSEPYMLAEIAERDRFRCGLCGVKVQMSLSGRDPMGPTVDHIVPIVDGGDDTRANVQLAHRRCNMVKGAFGAPQQLALLG